MCAKDLGEECGGIWELKGTCGEGLTCYIKDDPDRPWLRFTKAGVCVYKYKGEKRVMLCGLFLVPIPVHPRTFLYICLKKNKRDTLLSRFIV